MRSALVLSVAALASADFKGKTVACAINKDACAAATMTTVVAQNRCSIVTEGKASVDAGAYVIAAIPETACATATFVDRDYSDSTPPTDADTLASEKASAKADSEEYFADVAYTTYKGDDICADAVFKNTKLCGGSAEFVHRSAVGHVVACGFKSTADCKAATDRRDLSKASVCMPVFDKEEEAGEAIEKYFKPAVTTGSPLHQSYLFVRHEDYGVDWEVHAKDIRLGNAAAFVHDTTTDKWSSDATKSVKVDNMGSCSTVASISQENKAILDKLEKNERPSLPKDLYWTMVDEDGLCEDNRFANTAFCRGPLPVSGKDAPEGANPDSAPVVGLAVAALAAALALRM